MLSMSQFQVDSVDIVDVPNAPHEHSNTFSQSVSVVDYILIHQDSQPLPLSQPQSLLLSPQPLNIFVQIVFVVRFFSIAWFSWILLKKTFAEVSKAFVLWCKSCSIIVARIRGYSHQDLFLPIQDDMTNSDDNFEIVTETWFVQNHTAPTNSPAIAGEKKSPAKLLYLPVLASIISYTLIASQETVSVFGGYASFRDVEFLRTNFDLGALGQLFYSVLRICRFVCKEFKSNENVLEYLSVTWLFPENKILFFSATSLFTFMTRKFGYSWAEFIQKSGLQKPLKYTEDVLDCAHGLFTISVAPYIFYRFLIFFGVKRSWSQIVFFSLVFYNLRQTLPIICGQIWPLLLYLALQIVRFKLQIPSFLREDDENIWAVSYSIYVLNFVLIAAEIGAHYAKYQDSTVLYESDLNFWKLSSEFSDFQNVFILYIQSVSCSTPIILFWT